MLKVTSEEVVEAAVTPRLAGPRGWDHCPTHLCNGVLGLPVSEEPPTHPTLDLHSPVASLLFPSWPVHPPVLYLVPGGKAAPTLVPCDLGVGLPGHHTVQIDPFLLRCQGWSLGEGGAPYSLCDMGAQS